MSVRNRYCCICARSQAKKSMPDEHVCFRNWTKSASAMEADIIVEGFKSSVLMHNLKYNCLIGKIYTLVFLFFINSKVYLTNIVCYM